MSEGESSQFLYTAAMVRELDRRAIDEGGTPAATLMARAAARGLREVLRRWPRARRIAVVCGSGNNGGDGYLLAARARSRGIEASVIPAGEPAGATLAGRARQQAHDAGVGDAGEDLFGQVDVIVDGLLGTGLSRPVSDRAARLIDAMNAASAPVLSLDIPSGLCADTGRVLGCAVRADVTVSFIGLKRGLFTLHGPDHAGAVVFDDLAVASGIRRPQDECWHRLAPDTGCLLPGRALNAHKGHFGTVLVLGGDRGMGGAVIMAAEAALRAGAGRVLVATRTEHIAPLLTRCPEAMAYGVEAPAALEPLLARATVLVAGPGLGASPWSEQLLAHALASSVPAVLDADALNALAPLAGELPKSVAVITPHPGEAARLLALRPADIAEDRFHAARELRSRSGAVTVLKGRGTLISAEDFEAVCEYGNPGMAGGGMGDVLSGVVGACLAQGLAPGAAARAAVVLHARAADEAARDGMRGLLATDLLPELRRLLG